MRSDTDKLCSNFSDARAFAWYSRKACSRRKPPCALPRLGGVFRDEEGRKGKDKLIFSGKDCTIRVVAPNVFDECRLTKPFNVVSVGGSVARGHFVALCALLGYKVAITEANKHEPNMCGNGRGINIWHMFLPGIYTLPSQT